MFDPENFLVIDQRAQLPGAVRPISFVPLNETDSAPGRYFA